MVLMHDSKKTQELASASKLSFLEEYHSENSQR